MGRVWGLGLGWLLVGTVAFAQAVHTGDGRALPAPPPVDAQPVVDNYSGTKITDDFRWLEDAKSPETRAFIDERECLHDAVFEAGADSAAGGGRPGGAGGYLGELGQPIERGGSYYFMSAG